MSYLYYPGCSVKSTNRAYEESLLAVMKHLDLTAPEIDDWNCCGATAYMSVDEVKAFALAARNLALAERQAGTSSNRAIDLIVPCSGCYLVLYKTSHYLEEYAPIRERIRQGLDTIGLSWRGDARIRHPLDVFVTDVGLTEIEHKVTRSLSGLKVACYYGCQMLRPFEAFDNAADPTFLDELVVKLGGQPVDWPLKTRCCGGSLMGTIHEVGLRLSYILLREARQHGAEVLITTCPLCQINLECYQDHMKRLYGESVRLPVLYFTQLMGLAFGLSKREVALQRLFVQPVLSA